MYNKQTIIGRLTRDPEMKTTSTGKKVVSFSVAVDNQGKDKGTSYFNCQAWEKTAEFVAEYLGKGRLVLVEGRMQSRSYQDSNDQKREVWELTANEVRGLDRPKDDVQAQENDPYAD